MIAVIGGVIQLALRTLDLGRDPGLDLTGANLIDADLYGADLYGADLRGADLRGADLRGADLSRAYLYGANLTGADLSRANLRGADLSSADLRGEYLRDADLTGANLTGANLSRANLTGANLSRANLTGANLTGAVGIVELPVADPRCYRLVATLHGANWLLTSGCRGPWTVAEARAHWGATDYKGDPLTARRYLAALDWWERKGEDYRRASEVAS